MVCTGGGSRILTTVLQSISNVVDFGMNAQTAVSVPRMHHQWQPDELWFEPGFSADTTAVPRLRAGDLAYFGRARSRFDERSCLSVESVTVSTLAPF